MPRAAHRVLRARALYASVDHFVRPSFSGLLLFTHHPGLVSRPENVPPEHSVPRGHAPGLPLECTVSLSQPHVRGTLCSGAHARFDSFGFSSAHDDGRDVMLDSPYTARMAKLYLEKRRAIEGEGCAGLVRCSKICTPWHIAAHPHSLPVCTGAFIQI